MDIVHLSTHDGNGGAARAAYRLHRGLRESGVKSSMFVKSKDERDSSTDEFEPDRSFLNRLTRRVKRRWLDVRRRQYEGTRPAGLEPFSQAQTLHGHRVMDSLPEADVYNLHWIRNFIDPLPFFRAVKRPVIWTLHDMNPFTGGCHYNIDCRKFEGRCGACPQLGSSDENDLSRTVWSRKRAAYRTAALDNRLHVVAPSQWLAKEARNSGLFSEVPVRVIPYGLDTSTFYPRDTRGVRNALGITSQQRIILFVAQSVQNRRKGFDLLVEAFSSFEKDDVALLSIGSNEPELDTALTHIHLGTITSDPLLSVFYSLADLFVIPSRQDNLPNTVLESMSCGTPVVGFDTGGIPDMVRPGETGWLAEVSNVRALRDTIEQALSDDTTRKRMGRLSREIVEDEYTLEIQARKYAKLYRKFIK